MGTQFASWGVQTKFLYIKIQWNVARNEGFFVLAA
jgi:hypothetical protein